MLMYIGLIVTIFSVPMILVLCILFSAKADATQMPQDMVTTQSTDVVNDTVAQNGMPLDAISYDAPAWMPGCCRSYRVYDRTNGEQWWLLVMNDGYVVLPIGGTHDAV